MKFKLKIIYYWLKTILLPKFNSKEVLAKYQAQKLDAFAKTVLTKSPYYKKFILDGKIIWDKLPQMSKTQFMQRFDEINTQNILLDDALKMAIEAEKTRNFKSEINGITVGLSTGTSGKRGVFLVSENERAMWVAIVMQRVIKPKLFTKQKVAFFLRANSNLYASVASNLFEFKYFDIFKSKEELYNELQEFQPDIVASQPSLLVDIAEAQKNKIIEIKPQQIISFAEVLHQSDKEYITNIFPVKFTEVYQCTEGFLGVSCDKGTMHLNEDLIHFDKEWIESDSFYPIITDFSRHSQPIVKYKLNDILKIKNKPCSCGSPFLAIEKIIGREDDVLLFSGTKIYPDLISRRIALKTDTFNKYSITQTGANELLIGIECEQFLFDSVCNEIENAISELLVEFRIIGVTYTFTDKIDHTIGNKLRKIKKLNYENKDTGN